MKTDMLRQRKFLGIMGMIIPILIVFSRLITTYGVNTLESISSCHYYKDYLLFEGIMVAVGVFLIFYKGFDIKDNWLATCAGICAILVGFFPCFPPVGTETSDILLRRNIFNLPIVATGIIHDVSAIGFFTFLIIIITCQFTKTGGEMTKQKRTRNKIYLSCGILMGIAILIGGTLNFFKIWLPALFVGEAIGLELFGIAWIIKGELLFKDKIVQK